MEVWQGAGYGVLNIVKKDTGNSLVYSVSKEEPLPPTHDGMKHRWCSVCPRPMKREKYREECRVLNNHGRIRLFSELCWANPKGHRFLQQYFTHMSIETEYSMQFTFFFSSSSLNTQKAFKIMTSFVPDPQLRELKFRFNCNCYHG